MPTLSCVPDTYAIDSGRIVVSCGQRAVATFSDPRNNFDMGKRYRRAYVRID